MSRNDIKAAYVLVKDSNGNVLQDGDSVIVIKNALYYTKLY